MAGRCTELRGGRIPPLDPDSRARGGQGANRVKI